MTPVEVTPQPRAITPWTDPLEPQEWYQQVYKKYGYEPKHRTPSYFGPYLLLQTLGEGEFAKVKSGVHVQTNQEVFHHSFLFFLI